MVSSQLTAPCDRLEVRRRVILWSLPGVVHRLVETATSEVLLSLHDNHVCVTWFHLPAADAPGGSGGSQSSEGSCPEVIDLVERGIQLASSGEEVGGAILFIPPLSYFDQEWTVDVDAAGTPVLSVTDRMVLVEFPPEEPIEDVTVTIECGCGDQSATFSLGRS